MKHFRFIPLVAIFLLSSCSCSPTSSQPFYPPTNTGTSYTPVTDEDPFPEYIPPEIDTHDFSKEAIPVNFSVVNDFHGQIDEEVDDYRVGLAKMSTYLKDRKQQGDILISNGDMYQGSYLVGVDHGQFVSYAFKNMGFDAYVLGNHEFDWGVEKILDNQAALGQNFLCANSFEYPYLPSSETRAVVGQDYKIINLYEGTQFEVKVGIIGAIGKDQISSINSLQAENIIFLEPTEIVKNLAIKLREQENCDYVIASYHDGEPDTSIADTVSGEKYKYVDACFMAHTHKYDYKVVNGVPFIQASAYSRAVSTVRFSFNKVKKTSTLTESKYEYLSSKSLSPDPIMVSRINDKKAKYEKEYTEIVGNNATEQPLSVGQMSQFYAKLTYDRAIEEYQDGFNIVGCMFNESRRSLKAGEFTYAELYETHPFLNGIYIFSVAQSDIFREKKYSYGYIDPDTPFSETLDLYFDVLVFDYNGFHIGVSDIYEKYYNYFPSAFRLGAKHEPIKVEFNCLDVALEYLKENEIKNDFFNAEGMYSRY